MSISPRRHLRLCSSSALYLINVSAFSFGVLESFGTDWGVVLIIVTIMMLVVLYLLGVVRTELRARSCCVTKES